jgi:hypothetical protein
VHAPLTSVNTSSAPLTNLADRHSAHGTVLGIDCPYRYEHGRVSLSVFSCHPTQSLVSWSLSLIWFPCCTNRSFVNTIMVAYAPYLAATASLSSVYHAPSAIPKVFSTASTCKVVTATVTQYATARPTTNAHGHGGPYYNPYNDVDLPFEWPGKPFGGQKYAPPQPTVPYQYGGPAKDQYEAPCWIPKGSNKLVPSLPKGQQDGNSQWGEIDCPHLPVGGLPGGPSYPSPSSSKPGVYPPYPTGSGRPYQSGSGYNYSSGSGYLYPTTSSSPYKSANGTKTSSSFIGTGTSTPTNSACPKMPDTGVTRTYDLHVAYQTIAPDGVTRNGYLILPNNSMKLY